MRIIQGGNNSRLAKSKFFECHYCGCYTNSSQYNESCYTCKCPCCSTSVTTNDYVSTELQIAVDDIERAKQT